MKRSLQLQLSRMLAIAILAAGLVAALASFRFAYHEAEEYQDDALRKIAEAVASVGVGESAAPKGAAVGAPRAVHESDSPVRIFRLRAGQGADRPSWLPVDLAIGFHTLSDSGSPMRVFVQDSGAGTRFAVAQATEVRDESAFDSALYSLVPLVVLLPLLAGLTIYIVRAEFAPVRKLARRLLSQPADQPEPLPDAGLPAEVASFVQAINGLLARVRQLLDEQRRFIADAAHELRTPLTALSLQAQNLGNVRSLAEMNDRMAPLLAGIDRVRQLTEQLLTLARTQAAPRSFEPVDLSRLSCEVIADCLHLAQAKGIDLGMEESARLTISANAEILRLILRNALENAVRYTPDGGEVNLRLALEDGCVTVEVTDSGPGIPEAERSRVFDPFYRIAGTRGEGSGLGLAIAREAATRLGGTIELRVRTSGQGLVFRYCQPAIQSLRAVDRG